MKSLDDVLTDITVDVELNIGVVRPYDSVYTQGEVLEEKPEAEKNDAEVRTLPDEVTQEHEKKHCCRQNASDRIEGVGGVDYSTHVAMFKGVGVLYVASFIRAATRRERGVG